MGYMMIDVANWQDPCWQYWSRRCALDTMPRSLHMSFGRSWTGVEILVDKFLADVWESVEESASNRLEEG